VDVTGDGVTLIGAKPVLRTAVSLKKIALFIFQNFNILFNSAI
jgi:hypothetical protein